MNAVVASQYILQLPEDLLDLYNDNNIIETGESSDLMLSNQAILFIRLV